MENPVINLRHFKMDLPEEKGTYILITSVSQVKCIEVGSLGRFEIIPGFYAYVGSAFGSGGLRARLRHHLESTAEPHWHIDYLVRCSTPVEIWYSTDHDKLEHDWAELLEGSKRFRVPIPRFGSSDYHRSRASHLFYSKKLPSFSWFRQKVVEASENVPVQQHLIQGSKLPDGT